MCELGEDDQGGAVGGRLLDAGDGVVEGRARIEVHGLVAVLGRRLNGCRGELGIFLGHLWLSFPWSAVLGLCGRVYLMLNSLAMESRVQGRVYPRIPAGSPALLLNVVAAAPFDVVRLALSSLLLLLPR